MTMDGQNGDEEKVQRAIELLASIRSSSLNFRKSYCIAYREAGFAMMTSIPTVWLIEPDS